MRGKLALTPELVARAARAVEDPGPDPAKRYFTEAEFDASVAAMLEGAEAGAPVWVFACGSLIWKPAFAWVEQRPGVVRGWHRSFCLKLTRWRGTKAQPGLMMALDRGGQCKGVVYRLPAGEEAAELGKLWRREMSSTPPNNLPRWLRVRTAEGPIRAIGFVANPAGRGYVGRLSPEATADLIARGCGHLGSCAEYLLHTVAHLEELGIRDRNLWHLQALVAERLQGMPAGGDQAAA